MHARASVASPSPRCVVHVTHVTRLTPALVVALASLAWLPGCDRGDAGGAPAASPADASSRGTIRFEDVTEATGIRFSRTFGGGALDNIVKATGGGVAVLDADGDGWMDLYFTNGGLDPDVTVNEKPVVGAAAPRAALWRNRGDGTFEDVTERAGVGNDGSYAFGATAADYDGDGRADLYVCNYRGNRLYHNEGGGRFTDVTEKAGVAGSAWSTHAVFLDFDRDGVLDLYVVNYLTFDPKYRVFYAPEGFPGPLSYAGAADVLYRGRGDGTFQDVTAAAGVLRPEGRGMSAVASDFDGDGWTDVFVANDAMENFFWRNRGDGTFENVAPKNGTAYGLNGESTSAMGPAVADYDRDGALDLYVPDTAFSCLYTNAAARLAGDGPPTAHFKDRSAEARVAQAAGQSVGWSGVFLDADLDGWPDLFRSSGNDHHLFAESQFLLRNRGDRAFDDVSRASGPFFLTKLVGRAAAGVDLFNDGRLGLVITAAQGRPVVLRNTTSTTNHALALDLRGASATGPGRHSTRSAIGARVIVTTRDGVQTDEARAGSGYLSSGDPRLHFGLGAQTGARVEIRWPSGATQTLDAVAADRITVIEEPAPAAGR